MFSLVYGWYSGCVFVFWLSIVGDWLCCWKFVVMMLLSVCISCRCGVVRLRKVVLWCCRFMLYG